MIFPRFILLWIVALQCFAGEHVSFTTLNCYWFVGQEEIREGEKPRTTEEYSLKAGHLIGLLPKEAPLFIALQEVGNDGDVQALAHSASRRYKRGYRPLFVQGKDTATKQDVGALLDTSRGWGVYGKPSRVSDLERELSKHLVLRLTNATTHIDVAVVHLRVPRNAEGKAKQVEQNRALLRWSMRHLSKNPTANLMILGDFNEGLPPKHPEQSLAVLFGARPRVVDSFDFLSARAVTHAKGGAYDRILLTEAIVKGVQGLRFQSVSIQKHANAKGEARRLYTDHFPVTVTLTQ
ncbi:MAG TPA: hypothetical protein VEH27_17565 [Methylomirabilota bacterium]|nr:hypothetical protein [Methylomirabilota bacterium]